MMKNLGVSVVMPAYNASKTIARAIESVLSQTHQTLELIIIDDCSTDDTYSIMQRYSMQDTRVRVYQNAANMGVAATRNYGVKLCECGLVAFLDSDDFWLDDKLRIQLSELQKHPEAKLCFTGSAFINEKGFRSEYVLHVPEKITFSDLLKQNLISCSSVLADKSLLESNPMSDAKDIHEDYAAWLSILKQIPYAIGIDEPLLVYQISTQSKSGNKLKAARMQWRTYRVAGVPRIKAMCSYLVYVKRNIQKYVGIARGTQ